MKPIASVNIMGTHYTVNYVDNIDQQKNPCGLYLAELCEILIRNDLDDQFRLLTLLHEYVHGGQVAFCLDMGADSERTADCIALLIYNLIRDNPKLVRAIQNIKRGEE